MFVRDTGSILPKSTSCFLADVDLISKIFAIQVTGYAGLFGARLFPNRQFPDLQHFEMYINMLCFEMFHRLFDLFKHSGVSKSNIVFGARGHVRKSRKHRNEEFLSLA